MHYCLGSKPEIERVRKVANQTTPRNWFSLIGNSDCSWRRALATAALCGVCLVAPVAQAAKTQIRIEDAPSDRVLAFNISIASPIVLTHPNGTKVNVAIPAANRVEFSHLSGQSMPLAIVNVPNGVYTSATLTILNPAVQFIVSPRLSGFITGSASQTITVPLALTIGPASTILDINVNSSVALVADPTSGVISGINFTPASMTITARPVSPIANQQDVSGQIEDATGTVTAVTATTTTGFTMVVGQSHAKLTFLTNSNTNFIAPLTGVVGLLNEIVKVEGVAQANGSLLATRVEGLTASVGSELEGWSVGAVSSGGIASSVIMGVQDGAGTGVTSGDLGAGFNVNVSSLPSAKYQLALGNIDTSGLTVPGPLFPFDGSSIIGGQRIQVASASPLPVVGGTLVANVVKLKQQSITGQVTTINGTSVPRTIVITLPLDSAVHIQSHLTTLTMTVYQQPGTDNRWGAFGIGDTIRVRGLLFNAGGTLNMIARRILTP